MTDETYLGQILRDGAWLDYARGNRRDALRFFEEDPATHRVVDWISGDVIFPPSP